MVTEHEYEMRQVLKERSADAQIIKKLKDKIEKQQVKIDAIKKGRLSRTQVADRVNRIWGYIRQHQNSLDSQKVCDMIRWVVLDATGPTRQDLDDAMKHSLRDELVKGLKKELKHAIRDELEDKGQKNGKSDIA